MIKSKLLVAYVTPFTEYATGPEAVFPSKKSGAIMNEDVKPQHTVTCEQYQHFLVKWVFSEAEFGSYKFSEYQ